MSALMALLEEERTELCGPRYAHDAGRPTTRPGHTTPRSESRVTIKEKVQRRMRTATRFSAARGTSPRFRQGRHQMSGAGVSEEPLEPCYGARVDRLARPRSS